MAERQFASSVDANIPLAGYVTDDADIIGADREAALSTQLAEFERSTKHQMVVVTVKTLNGKDVSDFTLALANAWGIGRKGHDDGVVVLIAPNERRARIEVGYGLEDALPNALCAEIIANQMVPRFEEGQLEKGIEDGVTALIAKLTRPN